MARKRDIFAGKSRKEIIKQARKIYSTFDNVDLRKPVSDYQYYKARRIIKDYDKMLKQPNIKLVKLRSRKQKLAAKKFNKKVNTNYKVFPLPSYTSKGKLDIIKRNGQTWLIEKVKNTRVITLPVNGFDLVEDELYAWGVWNELESYGKDLGAKKMTVRLVIHPNYLSGTFFTDFGAFEKYLFGLRQQYAPEIIKAVRATYIV